MCHVRDAVKLGISNQVIVLRQAGRTPHDKVMRTVRLLGEEIIPHFR